MKSSKGQHAWVTKGKRGSQGSPIHTQKHAQALWCSKTTFKVKFQWRLAILLQNSLPILHSFICLYIHVSVAADAYLILRGDNPSQFQQNPSQLFIPTESFRYVTWPAYIHIQQDRLIFNSQRHEKTVSSRTLRRNINSVNITQLALFVLEYLVHFIKPEDLFGASFYGIKLLYITHRMTAFGSSFVSRQYTLDCYLWHTTWLVWPCCSVSTSWAFSGTGEVDWLWNLFRQSS